MLKRVWRGRRMFQAIVKDIRTNKMALALISSGGRPPWTEG